MGGVTPSALSRLMTVICAPFSSKSIIYNFIFSLTLFGLCFFAVLLNLPICIVSIFYCSPLVSPLSLLPLFMFGKGQSSIGRRRVLRKYRDDDCNFGGKLKDGIMAPGIENLGLYGFNMNDQASSYLCLAIG
jgi:hypothetical protein